MLGAFDRNIIVMFHAIARTRPFRAYVKRKKRSAYSFRFRFHIRRLGKREQFTISVAEPAERELLPAMQQQPRKKSVSEQGQIFPFFLDALL